MQKQKRCKIWKIKMIHRFKFVACIIGRLRFLGNTSSDNLYLKKGRIGNINGDTVCGRGLETSRGFNQAHQILLCTTRLTMKLWNYKQNLSENDMINDQVYIVFWIFAPKSLPLNLRYLKSIIVHFYLNSFII